MSMTHGTGGNGGHGQAAANPSSTADGRGGEGAGVRPGGGTGGGGGGGGTVAAAATSNTSGRPPSAASSGGSSSGSGSSKHVKCIGRYVLTGTTLGKGNFARVQAAVHTLTRGKVAIKIIETDKIREDYVRKNLLREAQLMRRLRHPNIIRLYETMKTNNLYCLVTEVAEGGELLSFVRNDFKEKRLSEAVTRPFVRQLVSALFHLHSMGIVHRDLKMENILLDKKKRNIKIVDFGLSNAQKNGNLLQTHCGSPEYAAPELFIPGREYGPEVDVWSLGVNMYAMLVGKLPFRSPRQGTKRRQKLLEQITNGLTEHHDKEMAHLSMGARELIGLLLQPDPLKRVGLREAMGHHWITKDGGQPLHPFMYHPPDAATQQSVIELMSMVLEVSATDIKETVRRDRCDWLAAIFNLLIDQPEGRNIVQRMLVGEADEDQLVDASHCHQSMEHLQLSQGASQDAVDMVDQADLLTSTKAPGSTGHRHRHSMPAPPTAYDSSTLPITKRERKHRQVQEPRPLANAHILNPLLPQNTARRSSVATPYIIDHAHQPHPPMMGSGGGGRRLPMTPIEDQYYIARSDNMPPPPPRPHSRTESEPNPLPPPFRSKLAQKTHQQYQQGHLSIYNARSPTVSPTASQLVSPISPTASLSPLPPPTSSPRAKSPLETLEETSAVVAAMGTLPKSGRKKGLLNPILRPRSVSLSKTMSGSVDAQLHIRSLQQVPNPTVGPLPLRGAATINRTQVAPLTHRTSDGGLSVPVGWMSGGTQFSKQLPSISRGGRGPADIHAMMKHSSQPTSPYSSMQNIHRIPAEGTGGGGGGGGGGGQQQQQTHHHQHARRNKDLSSGGGGGGVAVGGMGMSLGQRRNSDAPQHGGESSSTTTAATAAALRMELTSLESLQVNPVTGEDIVGSNASGSGSGSGSKARANRMQRPHSSTHKPHPASIQAVQERTPEMFFSYDQLDSARPLARPTPPAPLVPISHHHTSHPHSSHGYLGGGEGGGEPTNQNASAGSDGGHNTLGRKGFGILGRRRKSADRTAIPATRI